MEGFDEKRVKRALKLPRGAEINMIISVGLGTEDGIWGERYRVPYDEVVFKK
jgi:nitroreductase